MDNKKREIYFDLPGLQEEASRFRKLLDIADPFDHILIQGPRGSGKSYFTEVFRDFTKSDPLTVNCAAIHPEAAVSEIFGHKKGAFTGATRDRDGYIKTAYKENRPLLLEELNSLDPAHQAKLLIYTQFHEFIPLGANKPESAKVRILATMNDEGSIESRADLLDRFRITVTVPPLWERRNDIFEYMAEYYPDLFMEKIELLSIFAYNWPGNLRELDRVLIEMKAGLGLRKDILESGSAGQGAVFFAFAFPDKRRKKIELKKDWEIGNKLFQGAIPWELGEIGFLKLDHEPDITSSHEHYNKKIRIGKGEHGFTIILGYPTFPHKDCEILPDIIRLYFLSLRHDDRYNGSLFDEIDKTNPFISYIFTDLYWELEEPASKDFIDSLRTVLKRQSPDDTKLHSGVTPEQVIKYILTLGFYKNVEQFLHTEGLRIIGSQKKLATHWGISTSTLNDRMKKLKPD